MVIALVHTIIIVIFARTSNAWDSIHDLVALAFNSAPRGNPLENCGTGVMLGRTLRQRVQVRAVRNDDNIKRKVELVFCDEAEGSASALLDPDLRRIEIGRRYG